MTGAGEHRTFLRDIQGLRAVAVTLVVLAHAGVPGLQGGFVGVDIFFVLSGYLITGLLTTELVSSGRIGLAGFYARRLKRLLPALLAMLVGSGAAALYLLSGEEAYALTRSLLFALTWTSNLFFTFRQIDYFDEQQNQDLFLHTWSLGVEEQFYLFWPLLLLGFYAIGRRLARPDRQPLAVLGLLVLAGLASWLPALWLTYSHPMAAYYQMPTRIWQFALGACTWLAASGGAGTLAQKLPRRGARAAGLAMIGAAALLIHRDQAYPGFWALLPSAGAALVLYSVNPARAGKLLASTPMVWLGDRSYSWYLWHWPVLVLAAHVNLPDTLPVTAALVLLSLAIASISYRLIELPFWRGRLSRFRPSRVIFASLVAMALVANGSMVVLAKVGTEDRSQQSELLFQASRDTPRIYADNCDSWYTSAEVKPCEYQAAGYTKTVALIGDSALGQWYSLFAALYPQPEWRMIVLTKSACPMVDEDYFYEKIRREYLVCSQWRERALRYLDTEKPDVIVAGSAVYPNFSKAQWIEGSERIFRQLAATAKAVVVVAASPDLQFNGPSCLLRSLRRQPEGFPLFRLASACSSTEGVAEATQTRDYLATAAQRVGGISLLDLTRMICPGGVCSAVSADGSVVYRDAHHITDRFARSLAPQVGPMLPRVN